MKNKRLTCSWRFTHSQRPRDICGLPASADGLCIFHTDRAVPNFVKSLEEEVTKPEHWLEGIIIKDNLIGLNLNNAQLPSASFEGITLVNVLLNNALLEKTNFRSCTIEGTIFSESNLTNASFDCATLRKVKDFPVDLRDAELGGVTFTGAIIESPRLLGARFSKPTSVVQLIKTSCFEMDNAAWDDAATVYGILGKRAAEDWDFSSSDLCAFIGATCKHRKVIRAGPIVKKKWFRNWIIPSLHAGPKGLWWGIQRLVWGYGLRPLRILGTILFVILLFGLLIFPFINPSQTGQSIFDHLIHSLTNFVTMDYQSAIPAMKIEAFVGAIEALLGTGLLSLFLVALAGKYVRRF